MFFNTASDINECNGTDACGMNANCNNTEGSFNCTCIDGYEGDAYVDCTGTHGN